MTVVYGCYKLAYAFSGVLVWLGVVVVVFRFISFFLVFVLLCLSHGIISMKNGYVSAPNSGIIRDLQK